MANRCVRWLVLCFAVAWFGVLVPVHNRGQIAMPGTPAHAARSAGPCHPTQTVSSCHRHSAPDAGAPESDGSDSCAVCFFIAGLDAPPPAATAEQYLGLAGESPAREPARLTSVRLVLPFHSRAPPAA